MKNGDKVNQIRVYSGEKYELLSEADAGKVCAVTGLAETYPGQGLGAEKDSELPILEPVLTYRIILPDDCNVHTMLRDLKLFGGRRAGTACRMDRKESGDPCATDGRCAD